MNMHGLMSAANRDNSPEQQTASTQTAAGRSCSVECAVPNAPAVTTAGCG